MGGAAVFPGGAVSIGDLDPRWESVSNLSRAEAARRLGEEDRASALGAFVCALRESFEEVGFLAGNGPVDRVVRRHAAEGSEWLEHLGEIGVELDAASLTPAGRWVTPSPSPMRFDARFFVTRADAEWDPLPDPAEVEDARWLSPAAALDELAEGKLVMAPPTISILQRILDCHDVMEAIARLGNWVDDGRDMQLSARVHPQVQLVMAPNPGLMTGPGTNTYVVGNASACVIDPAVDDDQFLETVIGSGRRFESILITHRHPDHIGGVGSVRARTGATVRAWGTEDINGIPVVPLKDDEVIECGDARLHCIYTPGHSSDHVCFQLDEILFSGDTILGEGTAVIAPPDGNLSDYIRSLHRLRALPVERIFPGHFRPVDAGREVIDDYLRHREARHTQILAALEGPGASVEEVVENVYEGTPTDLHPIAALTVMAHLEMASEAGRVTRDGEKWVLTGREQESDFPE